MTQATHLESEPPVWAKDEALPEAPGGHGWVDDRGRSHALESEEALIAFLLKHDRPAVLLVWTPLHERMLLPEELPGMQDKLREAQLKRVHQEQRRHMTSMMVIAGVMLLLAGYQTRSVWSSGGGLAEVIQVLKNSTELGVGLFVLLVVGFIPWYQSWKDTRELQRPERDREALLSVLRFEAWLDLQRAPMTRVMAVMIALVALFQWLVGPSVEVPQGAGQLSGPVWVAGLVKPAYHHGEWWRVFTAPFLHGNLVHFIMNLAALFYLGKRVELFARWPHLFLVFLFSAMAGSVCSAHWIDAPSIGASGGLMGWLGFLLVFESLHGSLVPRSAKRRLLAGMLLTVVIGLVGYRFVDNAAHFGGAVAGMLYAAIVFPKSKSNRRPQVTARDRVAGVLAALALGVSATGVTWLMFSHRLP